MENGTKFIYLKSKGINNIHDLDSLVIHAFIGIGTFCRRVSPDVYIDCSLYNPLLTKYQKFQIRTPQRIRDSRKIESETNSSYMGKFLIYDHSLLVELN